MGNAVAIQEQTPQSWVQNHQDWKIVDGQLQVSYRFKDFVSAFSFLTRVAMIAEEQNHHPHIENMYNEVTLTLSTHEDNNKITDKDIKLAEAIENLK